MTKTKPFCISKAAVWEAYEGVKSNRGSAGVDEVSSLEFEKNLKSNLYKLWNRMSSGSYMPPPVLVVEIPKKDGGKRPLGIPTVADRIAQMVVKRELEPKLDPIFHEDSFGYRPGKSGLQAVEKARERCWRYPWVLDMDIKDCFNSIPHELLLKAVEKHTDCKWVILYIKRWLVAPLQYKDGSVKERTCGTSQGSVVSPLLANLFLHYCLDMWLRNKFPQCPFVRYADDQIIHCRTEHEAMVVKDAVKERLNSCGLQMHPEKTKVVYCKSSNAREDYPCIQFDFLGYTFKPRKAMTKTKQRFTAFLPAVSIKSRNGMKQKMREWELNSNLHKEFLEVITKVNPVIKGWINYYGKYYLSELKKVLYHVNWRLLKWAMGKYKRLRTKPKMAMRWLSRVAQYNPNLFEHWKIGVKPTFG